MTQVAFHFNVPDKVTYACRLLRKARAEGKKVVTIAAPALLGELDTALWTFSTLDFLPHCRIEDASATVLHHSPIVLAPSVSGVPHHEVLVNLGDAVPDGFEGFERVIEVVTTDDTDRLSARRRWRLYAEGGHPIERRDLQENR
jgi:DNA polymerase-3 subunit chi